jgi:hypothetical protein
MSTEERVYTIPVPASASLCESELTSYIEKLVAIKSAPLKVRRSYRNREQMLYDIAHCVPRAIPSAYGSLSRNALRREALAAHPSSPLADKVARNPQWVA